MVDDHCALVDWHNAVLIAQMVRNERQEPGAISSTRYSSRIRQRYQGLLMAQDSGVGQPGEWFTGELSDCCPAAQNGRLSGRRRPSATGEAAARGR
jgi:hypothetical protein